MNLKKQLKNGVVMSIITLFLLLIIEGGLWLIFSEKKSSNTSGLAAAYQFSENYLFDLKPNVDRTFIRTKENGGDTIRWETNENGFRGEPLESDSLYRIMVIGDSNIQAQFSTLENTFSHHLEKKLATQIGQNIEVINAGVIAYGPDQSYLKLVEQIDIYQPNLVLLNVFADNDFGDLVKNQLFRLDGEGTIYQTASKRDEKLLFEIPTDNFWAQQQNNSKIYLLRATQKIHRLLFPKDKAMIKKALIKACFEEAKKEYDFYQKKQVRVGSAFNDYYDIDVATNPKSSSARLKIDLMRGLLQKYQELCTKKETDFLVTIQPSVVDLTENFYFSFADLRKYGTYDPQILTRIVGDLCQQLDLHHLDFYEVFMENNPSELYFKLNDNHWNDEGQAVAAEYTAKWLHKFLMKK